MEAKVSKAIDWVTGTQVALMVAIDCDQDIWSRKTDHDVWHCLTSADKGDVDSATLRSELSPLAVTAFYVPLCLGRIIADTEEEMEDTE